MGESRYKICIVTEAAGLAESALGARSSQAGVRGCAGLQSRQLGAQAWGAVGVQACGAARQGSRGAQATGWQARAAAGAGACGARGAGMAGRQAHGLGAGRAAWPWAMHSVHSAYFRSVFRLGIFPESLNEHCSL